MGGGTRGWGEVRCVIVAERGRVAAMGEIAVAEC